MAVTCITDTYDSVESLYNRYLNQVSLRNSYPEDLLSDVLSRVSLLINLIKVADLEGESDIVTTYCTELKTLVNYSA